MLFVTPFRIHLNHQYFASVMCLMKSLMSLFTIIFWLVLLCYLQFCGFLFKAAIYHFVQWWRLIYWTRLNNLKTHWTGYVQTKGGWNMVKINEQGSHCPFLLKRAMHFSLKEPCRLCVTDWGFWCQSLHINV